MTHQQGLSPDPAPPALPDSAIVPVSERRDGWTSERQQQFIEALADSGCVKEAAGRVGMTEQSAYRLRRRSDAAAFDAAWEAALEKGLQRIASMAFERAINGTVKRTYYHGELIAEEVVHSERLLIYLLDKGREALGRASERRRVLADWDAAIDSLGAGEGGFRVWRSERGSWHTNFRRRSASTASRIISSATRAIVARSPPGRLRRPMRASSGARGEGCAARERFFALREADA